MTPSIILTCVIVYSALLFFITWLTSRNATNETYFIGNRSSKWYIVAYGMIGASLSGVTFISVPGAVGINQFAYFQVVLGYILGYLVIAGILLPLYYKLQLTSIYTFLEQRFGYWSYKTGSFFFIISRIIGASFRLYIVVNVLQTFVFDGWGVPFWVTVLAFILLILLYTYEGGVKTIVYTDMLQTSFMLLSLLLTVVLIAGELGYQLTELPGIISNSNYSKIMFTDWQEKTFMPKMFFGGMFIAIAMTGLDQEMMQKNISCKNIKESQRNMLTFTGILVVVNLIFLCLGALLYLFASSKGITVPGRTDELFPTIALKYLGGFSAVFFVIGIISAAYPSADGALTALTTSFCFDMLGLNKKTEMSDQKKKRIRYITHFSFALILLVVIVIFRIINDEAVILKLFTVAGYTYGPLLGLYAFGLFSKKMLRDALVPCICLISILITYLIDSNSSNWFNGYKVGFELIIINGLFTYIGLWLISKDQTTQPAIVNS
ncbi:sodium:solute symporter [Bacteroidota bacterium]|nr:sodium:solute symporter [Bacteroidota bacterium]